MEVAKYMNMLIQRDKEMDDIYHKVAVHFGLSDTALWVLYMIVHTEESFTQQDLCHAGFFSKQTINSVINNLVASGVVVLEAVPGTRKSKRIVLTDAGRELAGNTIDRLFEAELKAYGRFTEEELKCYLDITTRLAAFMREETEKLYKSEV